MGKKTLLSNEILGFNQFSMTTSNISLIIYSWNFIVAINNPKFVKFIEVKEENEGNGMIEFWEVDLDLKSFGILFQISPQPLNYQFHAWIGFW